MIQINSLNEIDPNSKEEFEINATIIKIVSDGDKTLMRPIKFIIKLDKSSESITAATWNYNDLEKIKEATSLTNIYKLTCTASLYRETNLNISVKKMEKTEALSSSKEVLATDINDNKVKLGAIVKKYIKNPFLKTILKEIFKIKEFWTYPAAKSIHHAYPGGLAKHTLEVTELSIGIGKVYSQHVNFEMLITGSIIHDIGKLLEYNPDGSKTFIGELTTHIPLGIQMLTEIMIKSGMNVPVTDPIYSQLISIIASHHGKLECGSPSTPATIEALIISYADNISSSLAGSLEAIVNLNEFERSNPIKSIDGERLLKIDNNKLLRDSE